MASLLDVRARVASGALTPADAVALAREAVAAREPAVGAFASLDPAPPPPGVGPLAGVAVGVKDIIDVAGLPTGMGSPLYDGFRPRADAPVVARLRALGAVPLGKTTTTPFAFLDPTATRNPRAPGRTPGGSSAGSAAAVAAGMVPLALGTQTGGSVVRPAAFCGVVGVKPSFDLLPAAGVKPFSRSLDTVGLFAAGVADAAFALAALAGRPEIDAGAAAAPRFGVALQRFAGAAEPEAEAALLLAARRLAAAGAAVADVELPGALAAGFAAHGPVQDYEALRLLAWERARGPDALPPLLRAHLDAAEHLTAADYDAGLAAAERARAALPDAFGAVDVLLTFSAPGPAPEGHASTGDSRFNRLWTLMGTPCVTVPVPGEGPPLGVQVIAPRGRDGLALAAALVLERALAAGG